MQIFDTKSSPLSLITSGNFISILSPWRINVDLIQNRISVKKKNLYLIGEDEELFKITNVRNIKIDELLFGANIYIKVIGSGTIECFCIPKGDAKKIRNMLFP